MLDEEAHYMTLSFPLLDAMHSDVSASVRYDSEY